jgi:hypothetical protein
MPGPVPTELGGLAALRVLWLACRRTGVSLLNKLLSDEVPAFLAGVATLRELISPTTCSCRGPC